MYSRADVYIQQFIALTGPLSHPRKVDRKKFCEKRQFSLARTCHGNRFTFGLGLVRQSTAVDAASHVLELPGIAL